MQLGYVIKYVADMDAAVAFHRDRLGLVLRFASPFWTEFETGPTTLALHPASAANPAGSTQIGYRADDIDGAYEAREANGLVFTQPPTTVHGTKIAKFLDSEGAECSLGASDAAR